ncbi:MAG: acyl-ACP--UDP-N-acetylglucosamine O-acyltransferase [Verrucomicrobiales bacterium]
MNIHPTAIVHPDAQIADDVTIGPWVLVEAGVNIAAGCRIHAQVQLLNSVTLGENCAVHGGAILGGDPQDLAFKPETVSHVVIGDRNTFRENVTVHRSAEAGGTTRIGDDNFLMAGSHVGHDSIVGNHNVLANNCLLGGFVRVGNHTFLGGGSAYHQFCRVGDLAMVKGLTAISRDVPPFVTAAGSNSIIGMNVVGMRRQGFSAPTRKSVKTAFYHMYRSGMNLTQALENVSELELAPEAADFIEFFRNPSRKGICMR